MAIAFHRYRIRAYRNRVCRRALVWHGVLAVLPLQLYLVTLTVLRDSRARASDAMKDTPRSEARLSITPAVPILPGAIRPSVPVVHLPGRSCGAPSTSTALHGACQTDVCVVPLSSIPPAASPQLPTGPRIGPTLHVTMRPPLPNTTAARSYGAHIRVHSSQSCQSPLAGF